MNKDLPIIIKKIFTNPDPIIWQGIWLATLENLLEDKEMLGVWEELLQMFKARHGKGSDLQLNQYLKWELKAFVAQIVNLKIINKGPDVFFLTLTTYFQRKDVSMDDSLITKIYKVVNEE
ncbi:MAG: hypothetical protein HN866_01745 [Gammaproteobacteria bacterium]|nr:hypothetical protein [Gammaproteobacteria bacterium]|tara:strand:- start:881 stop:1240 length:360 start_codon:yes stop_codon:yes gene_type:complete